jgi:DNA-binding transcriptional MerR regulator
MRISELSRRSGVSVPTIKYYLRIGLLSPGVTTARNQASYGDPHLRRLRLVRALREIGGLSVKTTREILNAIDRSRNPGRDLLATIDRAGSRRRAVHHAPGGSTLRELSAVAARQGWEPRDHERALHRLAEVCVAAHLLDVPELRTFVEMYAEAADRLARCDDQVVRRVAERLTVTPEHQRRALAEDIVAAVVLSNTMVTLLHGIARDAALARLFAEWGPGPDPVP